MKKVQIAKRNIQIQSWVNFLSGVTFLVPIITIFYKYTGFTLFQIIVISNVSTFCIWAFELPTSVLADTTGRKLSLILSVICNALGALMILLFPSYAGFIAASVFGALYWSFWSGTGQAFLAENLEILKRSKDFGKEIGNFMFYEQLASLSTPLVASVILKSFGNDGYTILAAMDVVFAVLLVFLVLQLQESTVLTQKIKSVRDAFTQNIRTAKEAFENIWHNKDLKNFLLYRSLSHHMLFFGIILLPTLSEKGMPDWYAGGVTTLGIIGSMFASKYAYKVDERYSYNLAWVFGTTMQGICLIAVGLLLHSWPLMILVYVLFNIFDGIWQPSWNHILVQLTNGKAIATTRSIVFAVFALYITIGKQLLVLISLQQALIGLGIFILLVNLVMSKRILALK
jgi:MFS family permease